MRRDRTLLLQVRMRTAAWTENRQSKTLAITLVIIMGEYAVEIIPGDCALERLTTVAAMIQEIDRKNCHPKPIIKLPRNDASKDQGNACWTAYMRFAKNFKFCIETPEQNEKLDYRFSLCFLHHQHLLGCSASQSTVSLISKCPHVLHWRSVQNRI